MAILDFILNCACLLLWLNWRSKRLASVPRVPGIALIATLKRAGQRPSDRWPASIVLVAVLLVRAILYRQIGPSIHWIPSVTLGPIALHFRSDMFTRMLLFSLLGFFLFLATFYFSLLLVTGMNRHTTNTDQWRALVRAHLGVLARLPEWLMLLAPFIITFLFWVTLGSMFGALQLSLPPKSFRHLIEQAAVIGFSAWLLWQYVIAAVLLLHIVSSYVYLGTAPFWKFIGATARGLLRPLAWLPLRVGKVDLTPLLALSLLALIIIFAPRGLSWLYYKSGD
jgi:uncharacterized protein YggT (Ycf19 family)